MYQVGTNKGIITVQFILKKKKWQYRGLWENDSSFKGFEFKFKYYSLYLKLFIWFQCWNTYDGKWLHLNVRWECKLDLCTFLMDKVFSLSAVSLGPLLFLFFFFFFWKQPDSTNWRTRISEVVVFLYNHTKCLICSWKLTLWPQSGKFKF